MSINRALLAVSVAGLVALTTACSAPSTADTANAPSSPTSSSSAPAAAETASQAAPAPAANGAVTDGDWSASDIQIKNDGLGSFGGTLRLTGPNASSALVQLTVLSGGSVAATLQGASTDFSGTETVQLISNDKYAAGDYTYEIKVTSV